MIARLGPRLDFLTAADADGMKAAVLGIEVPGLGASVPTVAPGARNVPGMPG